MKTVSDREYDPMLIGQENRKALFNEVAALIAPKEGKAYLDVYQAEKGGVEPEEYETIGTYIADIASSTCFAISSGLMHTFGRAATNVDPDRVREQYKILAAEHDEHYASEIRKGETLTASDKIYNAHVEMNAATARVLLDRLTARLPK